MEPCVHCSNKLRKKWVYHAGKCPKINQFEINLFLSENERLFVDMSSLLDYQIVTEFFHPQCSHPGCKKLANPIPGPHNPGQYYCTRHSKVFNRNERYLNNG
jgi:hypothetical protein